MFAWDGLYLGVLAAMDYPDSIQPVSNWPPFDGNFLLDLKEG